MKVNDLIQLKELIKWKKENPEDYKQFKNDIKEIMKDLIEISWELNAELEKFMKEKMV